MRIEFYPEICCDHCNDVIHNHFDCPSCGKKYAGTDAYGEIDTLTDFVKCEECNARFKLLNHVDYNEWMVEQVPNEN